LDAYPYVPRTFWSKLQVALHTEFPTVVTIGEVVDKSPHVVSYFQGGQTGHDGIDTGLPFLFDFPFFEALLAVLENDQEISRLPDVLQQDRLYPNPNHLVIFVGNHDRPRLASRLNENAQKIKLAHALLLTGRGVPQFYAGDEIGMIGGEDPYNRRDF